MKKKNVFKMGMLLSLGLFSACSNESEMDSFGGGEFLITDSTLIPDDGVVLKPYEFLNEYHIFKVKGESLVYDFFNEVNGELPKGQRSTSFFVDSDKDKCYVINSAEELKSIYYGEREIPYINFDKYTLVIGQMVDPDAFYPVLKQELKFSDNKCHLTLYVPELDEVSLKGVSYKTQYLYYWALYPKFYTARISVSYVKEGRLKSIKDAGFKDKGYLHYEESSWDRITIKGINVDLVNHQWWNLYVPMNLPDDFKVEAGYDKKFSNSRWVSISGYVFEGDSDYVGAAGGSGIPYLHYVYLTAIEDIECPLTKEFADSIYLNWDLLMGE
jgi:hypothetical protein